MAVFAAMLRRLALSGEAIRVSMEVMRVQRILIGVDPRAVTLAS